VVEPLFSSAHPPAVRGAVALLQGRLIRITADWQFGRPTARCCPFPSLGVLIGARSGLLLSPGRALSFTLLRPRFGRAIAGAWRVDGDTSRLIAREQMRRRSPSRLVLEIDVGECLPIAVADDETRVGLLDGAAGSGAAYCYYRNRSRTALVTTPRQPSALCTLVCTSARRSSAGGWGRYPGRCGVAPLSALLRIGGKRKPRATDACGASRTGNLGEGIGGRRFLPTYARQRPRAGLVPAASQQGQLGGCGQRSAGPGR
jgi:hypothetical protein